MARKLDSATRPTLIELESGEMFSTQTNGSLSGLEVRNSRQTGCSSSASSTKITSASPLKATRYFRRDSFKAKTISDKNKRDVTKEEEKLNVFNPQPVPYNHGGFRHSTVIKKVSLNNKRNLSWPLNGEAKHINSYRPMAFVLRSDAFQWKDEACSNGNYEISCNAEKRDKEKLSSFVVSPPKKSPYHHGSRKLRIPVKSSEDSDSKQHRQTPELPAADDDINGHVCSESISTKTTEKKN